MNVADDGRPSRVVVTGATGFIGRHLVDRLLGNGDEVHATCRAEIDWLRPPGPVEWHRVDTTDRAAIAALITSVKPDVVHHLASDVAGTRDPGLSVSMLHSNLAGAVNLMSICLEAGVDRVVLAGSIEEPDATDPDMVPNSPYSAAKWAATMYARMFFELWGLRTTVLRIAMVYGPAQRDDRKLIPYAITSFLAGRPPELTSGGRLIDWVYIEDVVDAFVAAADSPGCAGAVIPIGSGTGVSIREVVTMIQSLTGSEASAHFGAIEDRSLDRIRIADVATAEALLGWRARTTLRNGLTETVRWYREQM